jgi:hypothetical protein
MLGKMKNTPLIAGIAALALAPGLALADVTIGTWMNYAYQTDPGDNPDRETWGTAGSEALMLYADHQKEDSNWLFSSEFRVGPGSFTDPDNNSSGSTYLMHKSYVAYNFENAGLLKIGKSQVPFGWKTDNFWPGDMLLGGYGEQMDVGVNYNANINDSLNYSVAYFQADDWGATSTDTADDNGHWGSSTTYRKVQTIAADIKWSMAKEHTLGFSVQAGLLQDLSNELTNTEFKDVTGNHQAVSVYYVGQLSENLSVKGQLDAIARDLPDNLNQEKIENVRAATGINYNLDKWDFYLEATAADTSTKGNNADTVYAFAPGAKYNYGNGWFYIEYLSQDGYIDSNGDSAENAKGNYEALYLTVDYYFSL